MVGDKKVWSVFALVRSKYRVDSRKGNLAFVVQWILQTEYLMCEVSHLSLPSATDSNSLDVVVLKA